MKATFTLFSLILFGLLSMYSNSLVAQTLHNVTVSSNSFSPSFITINVGDTVVWTNVQGSHNVNGTTSTFPGNPESFGNSAGSGWTYSFVFTLPGEYSYRCDPHSFLGMDGSLMVQDVTTGLHHISSANIVSSVFPVPASEFVVIELNTNETNYAGLQIRLVDQLGRMIQTESVGTSDRIELDVRHLHSGLYFFQLVDGEQTLHTGRLIVQ